MSARASLVNRASMSAQPVSLLCQYNTGILSPERREGEGEREEGGRVRAEGRGGEQRANVGSERLLQSL